MAGKPIEFDRLILAVSKITKVLLGQFAEQTQASTSKLDDLSNACEELQKNLVARGAKKGDIAQTSQAREALKKFDGALSAAVEQLRSNMNDDIAPHVTMLQISKNQFAQLQMIGDSRKR